MKKNTQLILNVTLFLIGVLLIANTSLTFDSLLRHILVLKNGSFVFKHWQKTQFPMLTKLYIFNWTNPEDFFNTSIKMHFNELDPLIIRQTNERVNIVWNDNSTLTYQQRFLLEIVNDTAMKQNVTTLDFVHAIGTYRMRYWKTWWKLAIKMGSTVVSKSLHRTYTANEFTFGGFDDPYHRILKALPYGSFDIRLPKEFKRLGIGHGRNYTTFFYGNINVGSSFENFGKVYQWNYNSTLPYYDGECNKIKGSTGEISPPHSLDRKDFFTMFIPDFCGDLILDYVGEDYMHSVKGNRYEMHSVLDNGTFYPDRGCYAQGEKLPFGVFNISNCQYQIPCFVSLPHFYKADSSYFENVDGLQPDAEKHTFYIIVEPNVNIPIKMCARIQFNWFIRSYKFSVYENVRQMLFPILWVEQCVEIPPHLYIIIKIVTIFKATQGSIGGVLILLSIVLYLYLILKNRKLLKTKCKDNKAKSIKTVPIDSIDELEPLGLKSFG